MILEANQNKNNCLTSNFYYKLKFPALFSVRNRWEKGARDFNLLQKLLTRQVFLFRFPSRTDQSLFLGYSRKTLVSMENFWKNCIFRNGLKSEFSSKFTDNNWLIIALKVSNEALWKGLCMPKYILQTWCGPGRALMLRLIHL